MIIYGTRATHLKSVQLPNEVCPNCNTKGSIVMSAFNKYAHIFWIPFFSVGRTGGSQCQHCQQVLQPNAMPTFLRLQYDQLIGQTKIPIWSFSGLALVLVLIAFGAFQSGVDKENDRKYLAAPLKGDIYRFKTKENNYTLIKVDDVTADSLLLLFNEYETDKMSSVYKLKDKPFGEAGYWVDRKTVIAMYDSNKIYGVDR